jgi:hypothetical protein
VLARRSNPKRTTSFNVQPAALVLTLASLANCCTMRIGVLATGAKLRCRATVEIEGTLFFVLFFQPAKQKLPNGRGAARNTL